MGYDYIVNPLTGRKVSIFSRKGHSIINEYLNQQMGGGEASICKGNRDKDCPPDCKQISVKKVKPGKSPYTYCRKVGKRRSTTKPRSSRAASPQVQSGDESIDVSQSDDDNLDSNFEKHCREKHQNYHSLNRFQKEAVRRECKEDPNCTWTEGNQCRFKNKKAVRSGPVGRPRRGQSGGHKGPCVVRIGQDTGKISYRSCHKGKSDQETSGECVLITSVDGKPVSGRCRYRRDQVAPVPSSTPAPSGLNPVAPVWDEHHDRRVGPHPILGKACNDYKTDEECRDPDSDGHPRRKQCAWRTPRGRAPYCARKSKHGVSKINKNK